jgi:hypothetical protein
MTVLEAGTMASSHENGQRSAGAQTNESTGISKWRRGLRYIFAITVPALVMLYIAGILDGTFAEERRLNASDTIMVIGTAAALFAALWPELFDRLRKVKLGGVEFEVLQRLDERQQKQQRDIDDIRFVLTLLLPPSERRHLENLGKGDTLNYKGNNNLRTELRRLRTLQLIETTHPIGDIKDEAKVDLKDYVRLTEAGHRYLARIAVSD